MTYSQDERRALCALLDETGPDAPTLCEGWTTLDLAAHLVLRERRPDAGAGLLGGPLSGYTAHVQTRMSGRVPYARLVQLVREGPPRFSLFALPGVDERANLTEYFVHHEDVRRAAPGWEPRKLAPELTDRLWQRLRATRLILRKVPVGVEFARDDVDADQADGAGAPRPLRITIRNGTPVVTVVGSPAELTLWAFGRTTAAQVRLDGAEQPVQTLTAARWRL
ncbi:MAG: TIGR03085 family protein [Kitasatospora sp.]|jgi:uncharacterized protein (TIGR03085 family)|nr:TIGR03085 family protein [Kitasatospora sp.]